MNNTPSPSLKSKSPSTGPGLAGLGAGILLCTVLYRHFPTPDLTDSLRIAGFAFLCLGLLLKSRALSKTSDEPNP